MVRGGGATAATEVVAVVVGSGSDRHRQELRDGWL
jgi:hypothetical protein